MGTQAKTLTLCEDQTINVIQQYIDMTFKNIPYHLIIPAIAQLIILYPYAYEALDQILCAPYGTLSLSELTCTCPESRKGVSCTECRVNAAHGYCLRNRAMCYHRRSGPLCTHCPACSTATTSCDSEPCSGDCRNDMGYYPSESTKCRFCNASSSCSGHGTCSVEDGTCNCTYGWARRGYDAFSTDCHLPCPGYCGDEKYNNTCEPGGKCKCAAPFCGAMCEHNMSYDGTDEYCGAAGYAVIPLSQQLGVPCSCNCWPKGGEPIAQGHRCQHKCPSGTNGNICGLTGKPAPYDGTACRCECEDRRISATACDTMCSFGATANTLGVCDCLFDNQDPQRGCAVCKFRWHIAEHGCTHYCGTETCLGGGNCTRTNEAVPRVECTCPAYHDPRIQDVQVREPLVFVAPYPGAFTISRPGVAIALFDKRILSVSADATTITLLAKVTLTPIADMDEVVISVPIDTGDEITSNRTSVHLLAVPVAVPTADYTYYYGLAIPGYPASITLNISDICLRLEECVAYNATVMYSCISDDVDVCGGDAERVPKGVVLLATHATLGDNDYDLTIHDTLRRGCAACIPDRYPDPQEVPDKACEFECTPDGTCNGLGSCNASADRASTLCICDHANNDQAHFCGKCLDTYFPDPTEIVKYPHNDPCDSKCISEAMQSPDDDFWYCSGHGTCLNNGTCDANCSQVTDGNPSGWLGPHCSLPCLAMQEENQTEVCSGHGTCLDNKCACDTGYFSRLCDVSCDRDDQSFYVIEETSLCDGIEDMCISDIVCGESDEPCAKLKCNGRECTSTYQYIHNGATVYYKPCDGTLDNETLSECTGFTDEQYTALNMSATKIRTVLGIYCDTGPRVSNEGFCMRSRCDCRTGVEVDKITSANDPLVVETLAVTAQLGGEGCQIAGCQGSQFPDGGDHFSMCGRHVPEVIADPVALYDLVTPTRSIQTIIDDQLQSKQQHCSHGVCTPLANQRGTSMAHPAPAGALAVRGSCKCRNTPLTKNYCLRDDVPAWAQSCCDPGMGGDNRYFGRSCMDECTCDRKLWWKGSCSGDAPESMALGCNCRAGYNATGRNSPQQELFCGSTCKTQCMGVANVTADRYKTITLTKAHADQACPSAGAATDPHTEGCYDGYMPCHGHGQCASADGSCVYSSSDIFAKKPPGGCQCHGEGITVNLGNNAELPGQISLYGGDDCTLECPGAENLNAHFAEHYSALHSSTYLIKPQFRQMKLQFFSMYRANICSGHGYCTSTSVAAPTNPSALRCTCVGDFGGDKCEKQCKLDERAWGDRRPLQSKMAFAEGEIDVLGAKLATYYGLSKCGPNAFCSQDNVCTANADGGEYERQPYNTSLETIAKMSKRSVTDTRVTDFFSQWSMVFVGEFAACKEGYYSSVPRDLTAQDNNYAYDMPPLVRWQLKRSCDALYVANQWSEAGNAWCCTYATDGEEWHDDTAANFNGFTHGGCPDGHCPNFATGRSCRECVSNAFTTYNPQSINTCPRSSSGHGYCAICAGGKESHMVHPFTSLIDASSKHLSYTHQGKWACERCLSYGRELSGEQQYALSTEPMRVCNNDLFTQRGKCLGKASTYSDIADYPDDAGDTSGTGSLLCEAAEPHYQLGLCECEDGWEGPTCAMPTKQSSCRNGGILSAFGIASPYALVLNRTYYKCVCAGRTGHYCGGTAVENMYGFASAELKIGQSIQRVPNKGAQLVECNDPTGNNPVGAGGRCETCALPSLDPYAGCIEYKAIGPDGIVERHQNQVKARSSC